MTAEISLTLLGTFQVTQQQTELTGFNSDKTRALLAYLAVEADHPHRRETLIGLFWPESTEARARANLSQALHVLRKLVEPAMVAPPLLLADAKQLRLNPAAALWIDVCTFTARATGCFDHQPARYQHCAPCLRAVAEAIDLYKGELLTGFSLPACPEFEQWLLIKRAELHRLAVDALAWLTAAAEQQGQWTQARTYAQRWVALEPLAEEPQQALAQILSASGQRHEALAHLAAYEQLLTTELGVAPSATLRQLQRQLTTETVKSAKPARLPIQLVVTPAFLATAEPVSHAVPVFVGRAEEVARLQYEVRQMLTGVGRCLFVTGEAGFGKSALLHQVASLAQQAHPAVVVVRGNCNAHTGLGDPYLPFREILAALTGEIEAHWRAGLLSQATAIQLWTLLPVTIDALLENGADLIGTLAPSDPLLARVAATISSEQLERLRTVATHNQQRAAGNPLVQQQSALFSQYTVVLQRLAQQAPLVLLIDDLQWADLGTISLLFHLARAIAHDRILILGAYRPSEVALGRNGQRHPLEAVLHELQRHYGAMTVALDAADSRGFVDQLVDLEPNALPASFRDQLWRYTSGNALFTLELLRGLQERGDLRRDDAGWWIANSTLDWERLPPRVEAVIGERIGRLAPALQALLMTASVEGEVFTAEVVAQVQQMARRDTVHYLSHELDRQHHLVTLHSVQHLGEQPITHYRFRHILFQKYLYSRLDEAERVYAHADVGMALEALYTGQVDPLEAVVGALAWHFEMAGIAPKAAIYRQRAGAHAARLFANEEAISHLTKALQLITRQPETAARQQTELDLRLQLGPLYMNNRGYGANEVLETYTPALQLCQQVGDAGQLFQVLWGLRGYYFVRGQHRKAFEFGAEALTLAQQTNNEAFLVEAQRHQGATLYHLGEFSQAQLHLQQALIRYHPQKHNSHVFLYGQDPGVSGLSFAALNLWMLGYPDQAAQKGEEAIQIARAISHPFSLAYALGFAAQVYRNRREYQLVQKLAEEKISIATEKNFTYSGGIGMMLRGSALAHQGELDQGLAQLRQGLAVTRSTGALWARCYFLGLLVEALCVAQQYNAASDTLREAQQVLQESDDQQWNAEILRLQGEVMLKQDDEVWAHTPTSLVQSTTAQAEEYFHQAHQIAKQQNTKALELRVAVSLAQLWRQQGKSEEAYAVLAPIYNWFTEGFDTDDLHKAKQLLEALR